MWEIVVAVFGKDKNWNQLDPRKCFNIFIIWYFEYIDLKGAWCFTLSNSLLTKSFPSIFRSSCCCQEVLFTLRVSSLLSPLNDASMGVEGSFSFLLSLNSYHTYMFTSTLAAGTEAESPCFTQLTVSKTCWNSQHSNSFKGASTIRFRHA